MLILRRCIMTFLHPVWSLLKSSLSGKVPSTWEMGALSNWIESKQSNPHCKLIKVISYKTYVWTSLDHKNDTRRSHDLDRSRSAETWLIVQSLLSMSTPSVGGPSSASSSHQLCSRESQGAPVHKTQMLKSRPYLHSAYIQLWQSHDDSQREGLYMLYFPKAICISLNL